MDERERDVDRDVFKTQYRTNDKKDREERR